MANRCRNGRNSERLNFGGDSKITADGDCRHEFKRCLLLGRKAMTDLDSILKSRDMTLSAKVHPSSQIYGFSSSHVWMCSLGHKEVWVPKNWCFWTVALEKTLEGPLDYKEIKLVNPKGNQLWILIRRTDAEAEAPELWPLSLGKIEGRRRGWQMRWLDDIPESIDMSLNKLQKIVRDRETWHAAVHEVTTNQTWLSGWTTTATATWWGQYM